jgi:hypothetical protein
MFSIFERHLSELELKNDELGEEKIVFLPSYFKGKCQIVENWDISQRRQIKANERRESLFYLH